MNYNELLEKLKEENFPELKNLKIMIKPSKFLGNAFMITLPFSKNIFYNEKVIINCNNDALKAVILHEMFHIIQFKRLNFLQKLIFIPKYHLVEEFRRKHEIEAHTAVVKKGFIKEIIELNSFVKNRHTKEMWENKISNYYLTDEEIKKIKDNYDN